MVLYLEAENAIQTSTTDLSAPHILVCSLDACGSGLGVLLDALKQASAYTSNLVRSWATGSVHQSQSALNAFQTVGCVHEDFVTNVVIYIYRHFVMGWGKVKVSRKGQA